MKGEYLRLRRARYFSQKEFAALILVRPEHLCRVEKGKIHMKAATQKLADVILLLKEEGLEAARRRLMRV